MLRDRIFTAVSLLLMPLAILYATQVIWMNHLSAPFVWMAGHPAAVGLFWVLAASLSAAIYGLCRRLFWAFLPEAVLLPLLAYISRCKMNINGAPLELSDFAMAGNAGEIAGFAAAQLVPSASTVAAVIVLILLLVGLFCLEQWRPSITAGFILACVTMALFLSALYPGPLQTAAVMLDEPCTDQLERNEEVGTILGLYTAWCRRELVESGHTDPTIVRLAESFLSEADAPADPLPLEETPDIIFITSESFFDVTRLPDLTFRKDPLPVFHSLSETCTNGPFLSNTYGGGTGHVEMEIFTGLTSSFLKEGDTLSSLEADCYDTLPSMVRVLRQAGYSATAVHSHTDNLYGRADIYPAIGFEDIFFREDFITKTRLKGDYISDESFANELIARYEERDPEVPCFLYGLSMENHQSYYAGKFSSSSGYPARCSLLDKEDLSILDALVTGLHDADASLGQLVDYFSHVDRPVILVFVGDHLPSLNLSDGTSIYTRLGVSPTDESSDWNPETTAEILSTDYLIWTNYLDEEEIRPDRTESCTLLGMHTLQQAGIPLHGYFSWLDEHVAPHMLLSRKRLFVDASGTAAYRLPESAVSMLDNYASMVRYLVYGP